MRNSWPNIVFRLCLGIFTLGVTGLKSQTANPALKTPASPPHVAAGNGAKIASIRSFRIIQEKDGPAVEILSTKPLVPAIQLINDPPRLVIDLANARLDTTEKKIVIHADQISSVRADQFQQNPPVARVVVDLLAPREYKWDAAGNRLVVHLGRNPGEASQSPFAQSTEVAIAQPPQPVVKAVRASGPLAIASENGGVGSSFTAGADTAVLNLSSGGEVRVCPGTTLSITPSQSRHNLLLGMNTGAIETHVALDASTDSVMTPDFRITLVGPGEFHYAFSADSQGNTCVRALPGNTASAIVTELLGDRTYQVRATDQLVFRGGQLDHIDMAVPLECGCPPPPQSVQRATNDLPVQSSTMHARPAESANVPLRTDATSAEAASPGLPAANASATGSAGSANELHVQVSAPLVFHATGPPPAPVEDVRALPMVTRPAVPQELSSDPMPPTRPAGTETASKANQPEHRGFFRKLGGFFAAMFH